MKYVLRRCNWIFLSGRNGYFVILGDFLCLILLLKYAASKYYEHNGYPEETVPERPFYKGVV